MNTAQRIAAAVTLLAVAVFLFKWAHGAGPFDLSVGAVGMTEVLLARMFGILAVGGAAVMLLGIKLDCPRVAGHFLKRHLLVPRTQPG